MGSKKGKGKRPGPGAAVEAQPEVKATYSDWVWWPNEEGRRSRAREEFMELPARVRGELSSLIKRLLDGETRFKDIDDLGSGIKELRYRVGNNHYRVLFFVDGQTCVGLTCFYKNQRKTEKVDLERAKKRMGSYGA